MARNINYNTKQKVLLNDLIRKQKHEFTVKDIYNEVSDEIGLTTIYRAIDKMVEDGCVSKSIGKDNITYYQYLGKCDHNNHFYLKCISCGEVEHVDCDCIVDLTKHVKKSHNFKLDKNNIIINGYCNKCSEGEK